MVRLLLRSLLFAVCISADIADAFVPEPKFDLCSVSANMGNVQSFILHGKLKQHDTCNII